MNLTPIELIIIFDRHRAMIQYPPESACNETALNIGSMVNSGTFALYGYIKRDGFLYLITTDENIF
jgi:hypothetical protein